MLVFFFFGFQVTWYHIKDLGKRNRFQLVWLTECFSEWVCEKVSNPLLVPLYRGRYQDMPGPMMSSKFASLFYNQQDLVRWKLSFEYGVGGGRHATDNEWPIFCSIPIILNVNRMLVNQIHGFESEVANEEKLLFVFPRFTSIRTRPVGSKLFLFRQTHGEHGNEQWHFSLVIPMQSTVRHVDSLFPIWYWAYLFVLFFTVFTDWGDCSLKENVRFVHVGIFQRFCYRG